MLPDCSVLHTDDLAWMTEENTYMASERPWEHADLLVDGSGNIDSRLVFAESPRS